MSQSLWWCESCQHDYETKEAYCAHLKARMVPCNPDTIERELEERREAPKYVLKEGVYRLE